MSSKVWQISPRDPVVAGDGGPMPALAVRMPNPLPPQPTLVGFVRSALVAGSGHVSKDDARALLNVQIRGPLLAAWSEGGTEPRIWVPATADAAGKPGALHRGELLKLRPGEGVDPVGSQLQYLVHVPSKHKGEKLKSPVKPLGWPADAPAFWPLEAALAWALDDLALADRWLQSMELVGARAPLRFEPRVHVALDDASGTAEAMALFSSTGWRYDDRPENEAGLLVEVNDPGGRGPPPLAVLGGEGRPSRIRTTPDGLPAFDANRYQRAVDVHAEALAQRGLFLRVQLLTPGCFGGALPPAVDGLKLVAAAVPGMQSVSGWNLQARGPRAVRRLAPAGSVYHFGPVQSAGQLLEICERLWLRPLIKGEQDRDAFLAAPGADGYALALPGISVYNFSSEG